MAQQEHEQKLRTYRVTFYRSGLGWRNTVDVVFVAYTDEEVLGKVRAYTIAKHCREGKSFFFERIVEIVQPEITRTVTLFATNPFNTRI